MLIQLFWLELHRNSLTKSDRATSFWDILKFSVRPLLSLTIILVPFAFVFTGLDPFKYIIDGFLGDSKYRNIWTIIQSILLRMALIFLACLEAFRSTAYLYTFTIILLDRWNNLIVLPVINCRHAAQLLILHLKYRILMKPLVITLQNILAPLLNYVFWGIVLCFWICVKRSVCSNWLFDLLLLRSFTFIAFNWGLCSTHFAL